MTSMVCSAVVVDDADGRDQRREPRTMALYREATLETASRVGLCVVKDLSAGGARIQTGMALRVDEAVTLAMPSGRRATGRIRWQQGGLGGIAFDEPTPPSWLLDRYADCDEQTACRKLPRVAVAAPVTVTDPAGPAPAMTCDLSTHGMRIAHDRALAIGPIAIELDGLGRMQAHILWSHDGQSGCVFDRPFSISEITDWLIASENDRRDPVV